MDCEDIDQAGDGEHPQHLQLRRGKQQVKPGAPGVLPRVYQRCQAAGVDELQAFQVDNDSSSAGRRHGQRCRDLRRFCYVKLPAQIATGAGLTAVRMPARMLLILTGLCTVGIAATPEPVTGPTSRHLAFAVSCVVTTAVWPVLVARRGRGQSWILGVCGCAVVTVVFAGLSCWLLIAARYGGGDLGMVERLTSAVQVLFPLVVALALRQTAQGAGNQRRSADGSRAECLTRGNKLPDRWRPLGHPSGRTVEHL